MSQKQRTGIASGLLSLLMGISSIGIAQANELDRGWDVKLKVPRPWKENDPSVAHLWIPNSVEILRGLVVAGKTSLEERLCRDPLIRAAAAEESMGVLYFEPALDATFNWVERQCDRQLQWTLSRLAEKSGHIELQGIPMLTVGHSTGGIFARNVAYWKPHRVIGILHTKSGNLQDGLWDESRSLAGVPFLAVNGEFEEYGPKGGDLGAGLRSQYSLHPENKKERNQTQWVMIRMQLLDRRRKNPNNLMGLVVHRNGHHSDWSRQLSQLSAQFIRSTADARLPEEALKDGVVRCRPLRAQDGWLSDPDIKDPQHKPASYPKYEGDKKRAFWHVDKEMALSVWNYHQQGDWTDPDPTATQPPSKRYSPPPILQDSIDTASSEVKGK